MKARPKRDWAVRTAELSVGFQNERERVEWIVRALRRAEKRGYQRGKSDGYAEGHEDQMKMRVLDTIERIDGKLARVEAQAKLIRGARERDRSEG